MQSLILLFTLYLLRFSSSYSIASPDRSKDFGNFITADEKAVYDAWYHNLTDSTNGGGIFNANSTELANNYDKKLAFDGHYIMHSMLNMLKMTGVFCASNSSDPSYGQDLYDDIVYVLNQREGTIAANGGTGQQEHVDGNVRNKWVQNGTKPDGTVIYHGNLIQNMMILDPITEFVAYLSSPNWINVTTCWDSSKTYGDIAEELLPKIYEVLDEFFVPGHFNASTGGVDENSNGVKKRWMSTHRLVNDESFSFGGSDENFLVIRFPDRGNFEHLDFWYGDATDKRGTGMTLNRALAACICMANAMYADDQLNPPSTHTRDVLYETLIENTLSEWLEDKSTPGNYIEWDYIKQDALYDTSGRVEDTGHGGIDVRAFVRLYELGHTYSVLSSGKLRKMALTFSQRMYNSADKTMYEFMDGTGDCAEDTRRAPRWLSLQKYVDPDANGDITSGPWFVVKEILGEGYIRDQEAFGFTEYLYVRGLDTTRNYPDEYAPVTSFSASTYSPVAQTVAAPACD